MSRPDDASHEHSLSESSDSVVSEPFSAYDAVVNTAPPLAVPRRKSWTEDELSHIRRELSKLTAVRIRNAADVEDIVQDTLLTLIRSCPGEELEKGPLVWSMGVLRNKIGNYYRKARYQAGSEEKEEKLEQCPAETADMVSPEETLINEELISVISGTVERLPQAQKTAMKMLIAGLRPHEIAKKMPQERYQTVINYLHRARKKLARELTQYGFGEMHEMLRSRGAKKRMPDESEINESLPKVM